MEEQTILNRALGAITPILPQTPAVAVVLGSGLGAWAQTLSDPKQLSYDAIPGLKSSTVQGHVGKLVFGWKNDVPVLVMQGRVHLYEGYSPIEVVRPVRLAAMSGVKTVILTNAAGGVNVAFRPGEFMAIRDQICLAPSPLIGENPDFLGTRFPDMSAVYHPKMLRDLLSCGNGLHEGVYLQVTGPQYETPAEIRAYRVLGADAVGMSTAIEAIAARHAGLNVMGLSCLTNMAAGIEEKPLSHEEVGRIAEKSRAEFLSLLDRAVTIARDNAR